MTERRVAFATVQRVQKVEETLKEFKRTRLVGGRMGGRTKWEIRWAEGEGECDCACRYVCKGPEGSER